MDGRPAKVDIQACCVLEKWLSRLRTIPSGKEVRTVKYHKPEIVYFGSAHGVIQGVAKAQGPAEIAPPNQDHSLTLNAYEADE